jgi:two-component system OmpR family response regulator
MRILHIDDDKPFLMNVKTALTREGFAVDSVSDPKEGLQLAKENVYDIILLDIGMPMINGLEALQTLRHDGQVVGIFMVSGQTGDEFKVQAFEAGADDYLTKPFLFKLLVTRMRAWLKRRDNFLASRSSISELTAGPIKMEFSRRQVTVDGRSVLLTPKEFMMLEYMLRNTGRIVTQTSLAQAIWSIDYETGTNVVEVHMNRLRKKIDEPGKPSFIQTVRGSGYLMEKDPSS